MILDLHMHSNASDGSVAPGDLVRLCAVKYKLDVMALTDHDTIDGLPEAIKTAREFSMRLIPGIEISCDWANLCIHMVGLGIDVNHPILIEKTKSLSRMRFDRAHEIARRLEKLGFPGMFDKALEFAANQNCIGRLHFSRALLSSGYVQNEQAAFDLYLNPQRPAYIAAAWPKIGEAVDLIHSAGGVAVLAHPGRYKPKSVNLITINP